MTDCFWLFVNQYVCVHSDFSHFIFFLLLNQLLYNELVGYQPINQYFNGIAADMLD